MGRVIILAAFALLLVACASPGRKACHTVINETLEMEITAETYGRFVHEWERVYRLTEGAEPEIRNAVGEMLARAREGSSAIALLGDLTDEGLVLSGERAWWRCHSWLKATFPYADLRK